MREDGRNWYVYVANWGLILKWRILTNGGRESYTVTPHIYFLYFFTFWSHDIMHEREFLKEMSDPSLIRKQFTSFLSKQLVSRLLTAIRWPRHERFHWLSLQTSTLNDNKRISAWIYMMHKSNGSWMYWLTEIILKVNTWSENAQKNGELLAQRPFLKGLKIPLDHANLSVTWGLINNYHTSARWIWVDR